MMATEKTCPSITELAKLGSKRLAHLLHEVADENPALAKRLVDVVSAEQAKKAEASIPSNDQKSPRVLVVEDYPANRTLLELHLKSKNFGVVAVGDGLQAIKAWERDHFDVILMDLELPGMSGYDAAHHIRTKEKERGTYTPIIAMSAHSRLDDAERFRTAGMDGHMKKPIQFQELFQFIQKSAARK